MWRQPGGAGVSLVLTWEWLAGFRTCRLSQTRRRDASATKFVSEIWCGASYFEILHRLEFISCVDRTLCKLRVSSA
jgi:hypothetical protein